MIRCTQGNLIDAPVEALVNTVNEVGVMWKGIALMFKDAFPDESRAYEKACERGEVKVGSVMLVRRDALVGPKWIVHFPTKKHWRHPSKLEWIRTGLVDLARLVAHHGIRSIAVPPLGCGAGGLKWEQVRPEILSTFAALPEVDVVVFEPASSYRNEPKRSGVEELTPARALIVAMVRNYAAGGIECAVLELQKLAWFLQRTLRQ